MLVKKVVDRFAYALGKNFYETIEQFGAIFVFLWNIFKKFPKIPKNFHLTMEQMTLIGISSLPIIFVSSIFVGAVTAAQAAYQFSDYVPLTYLGLAVGKAIMVELGPVLTALLIAGRIGAAMAAELGTMKVTEQIDAMECLALDPFQFLLAPRMFASIVMLPVLVVYAELVCILGALAVAVFLLGVEQNLFFNGIKLFFEPKDAYIGIVKGIAFGVAIALMGCYYGFYTRGGAEGVGVSTRRAVVAACVMILIFDYIIGSLLL